MNNRNGIIALVLIAILFYRGINSTATAALIVLIVLNIYAVIQNRIKKWIEKNSLFDYHFLKNIKNSFR